MHRMKVSVSAITGCEAKTKSKAIDRALSMAFSPDVREQVPVFFERCVWRQECRLVYDVGYVFEEIHPAHPA